MEVHDGDVDERCVERQRREVGHERSAPREDVLHAVHGEVEDLDVVRQVEVRQVRTQERVRHECETLSGPLRERAELRR